MVQTLATNAQNDIYIQSNGTISLVSGETAVEFGCASAARAQLGEMIYNTTQGIPNFQAVWIGSPNLATFEAYLRNTLLNVAGVTSIASLTVTYANNVLSYVADIQTQYSSGSTTING